MTLSNIRESIERLKEEKARWKEHSDALSDTQSRLEKAESDISRISSSLEMIKKQFDSSKMREISDSLAELDDKAAESQKLIDDIDKDAKLFKEEIRGRVKKVQTAIGGIEGEAIESKLRDKKVSQSFQGIQATEKRINDLAKGFESEMPKSINALLDDQAEKVKSKFVSIADERVKEVRQSLKKTDGALASLASKTDKMQSSINSIDADIDSLARSLRAELKKNLDGAIDSLEDNDEALKASLADALKRIDDSNRKIDGIAKDLLGVESSLSGNNLYSRIYPLVRRELDDSRKSFESASQSIESKANDVSGEIKRVEDRISAKESELLSTNAGVASLKAHMDTRLREIEKRLDDKTKEISGFKEDMTKEFNSLVDEYEKRFNVIKKSLNI